MRRAEGCQCSSDYERLDMTATKRSKRSSLIRNARGRSALSATSKRAMMQAGSARSSDQEVMLHLSRSQIFKDYERAFSEAVVYRLVFEHTIHGRRHTMAKRITIHSPPFWLVSTRPAPHA
jgi:hypothetical protein